jgi:yeast amino acid transporter
VVVLKAPEGFSNTDKIQVNFVVNYVVITVFACLYVFWKIVKRTKVVPIMEIDLVTGRREVAVDVDEERKEMSRYAKLTRRVFS